MESTNRNLWQSLGFMRSALIALALLNVLVPLIDWLWVNSGEAERNLWQIFATMIAPVMAPMFLVLLLIDYVMSRIHAADAEGEKSAIYIRIGRLELVVMAITLLFWVPYFSTIVS